MRQKRRCPPDASGNPGLRTRHWEEISEAFCGMSVGKIRNTISFSLGKGKITDSKASKVPAVTGICDGSQEGIVFFSCHWTWNDFNSTWHYSVIPDFDAWMTGGTLCHGTRFCVYFESCGGHGCGQSLVPWLTLMNRYEIYTYKVGKGSRLTIYCWKWLADCLASPILKITA